MSIKYPLFVVFVCSTPSLLNLLSETQAGDDLLGFMGFIKITFTDLLLLLVLQKLLLLVVMKLLELLELTLLLQGELNLVLLNVTSYCPLVPLTRCASCSIAATCNNHKTPSVHCSATQSGA